MTVMKIKSKHKLTPEMNVQIKESAKVLPPLIRLNKDGSDRKRVVSKVYKGSELPTDITIPKGVTIDPDKLYPVRIQETVYVNHEVEMINAFWIGGDAAIKAYVNKVIEVSKKERKETIKQN